MSVHAPSSAGLEGNDGDVTTVMPARDLSDAPPSPSREGPDPNRADMQPADVSRAAPRRAAPRRAEVRRAVDGPIAGTIAILAVVVSPVVQTGRILSETGHLRLTPSVAMSDLGARRASHLDQLLGPLTRFGFHQPGPALYYLLAAFVRLGPATRGGFVGATLLDGVALAVALALVWRRFGGPTALWTAAAVDAWCLCVGAGSLREPAATAMIVAPVVLLVVLWAAAVSGTRGAYLWALVVASIEVQTDLATAIFCIGMLLIGAVASMVAAGGDGRLQLPDRWWTSPSRTIGLVALVTVWVPPVVELTGGRPDNVRAIFDFVTHPYRTPGLHRALTAAATAMTTLPLGRPHPAGALVARSTGALVGVGAATLLVLALTLWLGYQRRSRAAYSFAAAAVVGGVIGALSLTRSVAGYGPPAAAWLAYVPLALLIGLGAALLGPLGPERAGPGFMASVKAPFKWIKKRLSKRAGRGMAAARSRASTEDRRREAGDKKGHKLGGKLGGRAKAAGTGLEGRAGTPGPQWARPAWWVVPLLIVLAALAATTVVESDLRAASLPRSPGAGTAVGAGPLRGVAGP